MEYLNVNFLGSEIMVINHDGAPYVAMHTVVNGMGLTWQPQHRKLTSNAAGKALNQRKLEKRQLEMQLVAINQLDLFKQTA